VLQEGIIVAGQPIPLGGLDGGDALDDLDANVSEPSRLASGALA